ncbi:MAG: LruC domain-containing protein [Sphingobacteriaceae bacterium]|nr:MAG: LruC domain-containing protein [Sphingobacteriaceae bacterium]
MKKPFYFLAALGLCAATSCKKEQSGGFNENSVVKIAPNGFEYKTSKDVTVNLQLLTNTDQPVAGAVINVYTAASANADDVIFKGVTDANGNLKATVSVASSVKQLIIDPGYVGLMRYARANISNNSITATIGGKNGYSGDIVAEDVNNTTNTGGSANDLGTLGFLSTQYVYPSPYNSTAEAVVTSNTYPFALGRPKYLENTPDVIDASLLAFINSSLPESQPVSSKHPEYLSSSATSNINVTAKSDVWITYVSEGASYQSSLAYYTYNTNNPPSRTSGGTSVDGIDKFTMVFPNASGVGSGGGLKSGDKVKLGTFEAGTTIAFALLQNSWTGSLINLNVQKFFSDASLNPEGTAALRKHSIVLYDDVHKLYLLGFEDTNRDNAAVNPNSYASDNDFNDIIFYASANPIDGISNVGVPPVDKGGDSDGDGVLDPLDAFPNDPTKAYISYFPSKTTFAQLAFEDNWPNKGDYDMNDLVVNYRYTLVLNAKNEVLTMQGDYNVAASGASFHNGFGVQLPVNASLVKSVTGQQTMSNYIQFASNGVEAGQSKAVIIPFDNHEALIHYPDYSYFINTLNEKDKIQSSTASVLVTFTAPLSIAGLNISSINPFLISDLRRGYEVHLPGYLPTDKANKALFATADDASLINGRSNYTSKENWPWAISFNDTSFKYPLERVIITEAYPHFSEWAGSNGSSFTDWYSNLTTGYRNNSNIYNK